MSARFTVTFVPMRGVDGVRALRWLLKRARRSYGLVAVDLREEAKTDAATIAAQDERTLERIEEQILERQLAGDDVYYFADADDQAE